jgi:hypothetical protein
LCRELDSKALNFKTRNLLALATTEEKKKDTRCDVH